jgi:hypothetical protein
MRTLGALLAFLSFAVLPASGQVPPALASADSLAELIDRADRDPELAGKIDDLDLDTVETELAAIAGYLEGRPEDPEALLLQVRLGRVRDLLAFRDAAMAMFMDPSAGIPEPPSHAGRLVTLEEILARAPDFAPAHYWMARLRMEERARAAEMGLEPPDPAEGVPADVLGHARAAVESAPDVAPYREFLAMLHVADGRMEDAAEALDHPATRDGLMAALSDDLLRFRPGPWADPDAMLGNLVMMFTMMGAADGDDATLALYPELRGAAWSSTATIEEVQRHFTDRWPAIVFFPTEVWGGSVSAAFVRDAEAWRAVSERGEYDAVDTGGTESVTILLMPPAEYDDTRSAAAAQGLPRQFQLPGARVGILYLNARRRP